MKKIFLFLLVTVISVSISAQKNEHTISFDGIGDLKLGMGKAELEKLLNIKIALKHIHVDEVYVETIKTKYLGKDVSLYLMRSEDRIAVLESITVTDPIFKMADGTGIGTDQSTIVNKYENQLLIIQPDYAESNPPAKKIFITLAMLDNIRAAIMFSLVNKKVVAIEVGPTPQFRDRE